MTKSMAVVATAAVVLLLNALVCFPQAEAYGGGSRPNYANSGSLNPNGATSSPLRLRPHISPAGNGHVSAPVVQGPARQTFHYATPHVRFSSAVQSPVQPSADRARLIVIPESELAKWRVDPSQVASLPRHPPTGQFFPTNNPDAFRGTQGSTTPDDLERFGASYPPPTSSPSQERQSPAQEDFGRVTDENPLPESVVSTGYVQRGSLSLVSETTPADGYASATPSFDETDLNRHPGAERNNNNNSNAVVEPLATTYYGGEESRTQRPVPDFQPSEIVTQRGHVDDLRSSAGPRNPPCDETHSARASARPPWQRTRGFRGSSSAPALPIHHNPRFNAPLRQPVYPSEQTPEPLPEPSPQAVRQTVDPQHRPSGYLPYDPLTPPPFDPRPQPQRQTEYFRPTQSGFQNRPERQQNRPRPTSASRPGAYDLRPDEVDSHDDEAAFEVDPDGDGVVGMAGVDYPVYDRVPRTRFSCDDQPYRGIFADVEARCQVYHSCAEDGIHDSFLCPNGTVFDQQLFVCAWWYNVDCNQAPNFYHLNQRNNAAAAEAAAVAAASAARGSSSSSVTPQPAYSPPLAGATETAQENRARLTTPWPNNDPFKHRF